MPEWDDPGMWEEPEPEKAPVPWSLIIAAAVIVVLIIAIVIIRKIVKKRKEKALLLEDMAFEAQDEKDSAGADGTENADAEAESENAEKE